ncbi:MAG: hypothetical protein U1E45_12980 [Geminicoccaceae bacterium]
MLAAGTVWAGSNYFLLNRDLMVCDTKFTDTCDVGIDWIVGNIDKFDEWKICWKKKESSTWLDDHCDYNSKVRKISNTYYVIPDLKVGVSYRIKLEGQKIKNGKWSCVNKASIDYVGYGVYLGAGGFCTDF